MIGLPEWSCSMMQKTWSTRLLLPCSTRKWAEWISSNYRYWPCRKRIAAGSAAITAKNLQRRMERRWWCEAPWARPSRAQAWDVLSAGLRCTPWPLNVQLMTGWKARSTLVPLLRITRWDWGWASLRRTLALSAAVTPMVSWLRRGPISPLAWIM